MASEANAGPRQGVILAAGHGSRLAPITLHTPKPLVPFFGESLLAHAAGHLISSGVERIAVNCHHLWEPVAAYVQDVLAIRYPAVEWHISHEPDLLGTGGALANLAQWLGDEAFWVVNSDAVFDADLAEMATAHTRSGSDATWMVTRAEHARDLRVVELDERGDVARINSPAQEHQVVFCGIHLAGRGLLERLPAEGKSCVVREGYLPLVQEGGRVHAWETTGFWADTGTPERYLDAHTRGLAHLDRWRALADASPG
ncbi:MAG: nucleotidyltransferase family protein [Myxococcota bacterium]|nr:nucleotidyltransferase family protein [Myxococcota bacterium]MEE2779484.1 nucleotidyltransferase family protein [Myxococcota bacterium]